MLVTGTGLIPYPNCRILFGSLMEMVKASFPCVLFSNKIIFSQKRKEKIVIYIYIKAEDVVIYLSFGMYDNVFCMTRGSLVG